MTIIRTIVHYPGLLPFEHTEAAIDAYVANLAAAGITHLPVNHLPDTMHPELLSQPENVYLWFADFGPSLDLFVSSRLNAGLYPESYLERNRRSLLRFAAACRQHGIKPILYLCEPRFVPERFFARHPTLRGPRVDNPVCSTRPLYALCTDRREVQDHYRELMRRMMELVPDLAMMSLFTSDSGSGFDYNPDQYAGPNGAGFNRRVPFAQRVAQWLSLIGEEGRRVSPQLTVNLTSGFPPEVREDILARSPPFVVGSVFGLFDWEGGLEDMWAYHQSRFALAKLDRVAALEERRDDFRKRYAVAVRGGRTPLVHVELPTNDYPRPLRYTPHPFDTIRVLRDVMALGATAITAWGVFSPSHLVPCDVNLRAMRLANDEPLASADTLVQRIAEEWVGPYWSPLLVDAWRSCDRAITTRPLWNHSGLFKSFFPAPLVPDPTALTADERAYYQTAALDDLERINGLGHAIPHEHDERNRDYVLTEIYGRITLPGLADSAHQLFKAAITASTPAANVLIQQAEHLRCAYLVQRILRNLYEMGRYNAPGPNPTLDRSPASIVTDDIEATEQLITLIDGRPEQFFRLADSDHRTYEFGPGIVGQLRRRVEVMNAHRDDPAKDISHLTGALHQHLKHAHETLVSAVAHA